MENHFITESHTFRVMSEDSRPQDPTMDLAGWTFTPHGHGGEYPDCMPQAIIATDPQGRSVTMVPIAVNGRVVESRGFNTQIHDELEPRP